MITHLLGAIFTASALGMVSLNATLDIQRQAFVSANSTFPVQVNTAISKSNASDGCYIYYYRYSNNGFTYAISTSDSSMVNSWSYQDDLSHYMSIPSQLQSGYDLAIVFSHKYFEYGSSSAAFYREMVTFWYSDYMSGGYVSPAPSDILNRETEDYDFERVVLNDFYGLGTSQYWNRCYISSNTTSLVKYNYSPYYFINAEGSIDFGISIYFSITYEIVNGSGGYYSYNLITDKSIGTYINEALNSSYAQGYQDGYTYGYEEGFSASGGLQFNFLALLGAIADTPVRIITNLYSFDLFGVSALTIFMSLFTAIIVIHFIRKRF